MTKKPPTVSVNEPQEARRSKLGESLGGSRSDGMSGEQATPNGAAGKSEAFFVGIDLFPVCQSCGLRLGLFSKCKCNRFNRSPRARK